MILPPTCMLEFPAYCIQILLAIMGINLKFSTLFSSIFSDVDDDGDSIPLNKAPNPIAAAGAVKDALATGGVDKVADMGKQSAAKLGGIMAKGVGGIAGKAFSLF